MILEQYLDQYCDEVKRKGYGGLEEDREAVVEGFICLYRATKQLEYRRLAEKLWKENEGKASLFLWNETQQEQYLYAARNSVASIEIIQPENCNEKQFKSLCNYLPFYMEYDVVMGGRKQLQEVTQWLQRAEKMTTVDKQRVLVEERIVLDALIGCFEVMPEEAYDLYRYLGDSFKKKLKGILSRQNGMERAAMAELIFKGCRLGILQMEKYVDLGRQYLISAVLDDFILKQGRLILKEPKRVSIYMKALGEQIYMMQHER